MSDDNTLTIEVNYIRENNNSKYDCCVCKMIVRDVSLCVTQRTRLGYHIDEFKYFNELFVNLIDLRFCILNMHNPILIEFKYEYEMLMVRLMHGYAPVKLVEIGERFYK